MPTTPLGRKTLVASSLAKAAKNFSLPLGQENPPRLRPYGDTETNHSLTSLVSGLVEWRSSRKLGHSIADQGGPNLEAVASPDAAASNFLIQRVPGFLA
jgi:hypothetical protein